jgi:hypothetical protein
VSIDGDDTGLWVRINDVGYGKGGNLVFRTQVALKDELADEERMCMSEHTQ